MNSITHDQELATANQNMYNTMITPSSLIYEYAPFIETNSAAAGPMMNSSQVSLSEASVCSSSMGIRTPDVHPVPDTSLLLSVTQSTRYGDQPMLNNNGFPQQWIHTDPVLAWPMFNEHVMIKQEPSCQVIYGGENMMQEEEEEEEEETASSSMRKSPHYRRNTVSLPLWCDSSNQVKQEESELRRQSMNDMNNICNLSREQLIQRVVQLEKEKELSRKISAGSSVLESTSTRDQSDQDDFHPCRWSGCGTSGTTLDQLIVHIRDVHIGSGKAAYYCQWLGCLRNQKPFLKRHKMQNHMRTHTGERPFECQIEDCDKKFSRPDSLNTHIKTHSSIRPYACPVENCGKAYFHSRSLRKHAKSHEPNQPTPLQHPYHRLKVFNNTPSVTITTTNTPNVVRRQQQGRFYADVKVMDDFEQQQQQIFAAGTAYYTNTTFDYGQSYYDSNSSVLMTDTNFNL